MSAIMQVTDEVLLKMCVAEDIAGKIIAKWKPEYGEILDFGGGERDLFAKDVLEACDNKSTNLVRLFGLSKTEATAVLNACK